MIVSSLLLLLMVAAAVGASIARKKGAATAAHGDPACGKCGYIVRGIGSLNCPECGSDLREAGITTLAMRRRAGPWSALVLWIVFIAMTGILTTALLMPVIPRLNSNTQTIQFRTYIQAPRGVSTGRDPKPIEPEPPPPPQLTIDIEVRSWEYRWSWAKQTMQPPMKEIVLVVNETKPVRLTIDVERGVCWKEPGPPEALPLNEETFSQWLKDAGHTPANGGIDGPAILNKVNRAILTDDPDIDLATRSLARTRSGSRGGSGQAMGGITEGLALFWIAVAVTGCAVIARRQRRQAKEA